MARAAGAAARALSEVLVRHVRRPVSARGRDLGRRYRPGRHHPAGGRGVEDVAARENQQLHHVFTEGLSRAISGN